MSKSFQSVGKAAYAAMSWLKTVPSRECDILVTFPKKTEDTVLLWVLARLRARVPELVVQVRHHISTGVFGFHLSASYENLLKGAEDVSLCKSLKSELGGGLRNFKFAEKEMFDNVEQEELFLTSQDRQQIVNSMLENLRAEEGDELGKVKFADGQVIIPILVSKNVIDQVFPLHNNDDLAELRKKWVQSLCRPQPLDLVCSYFGVKIAMYFAWLGHYTKALIIPTLIGCLIWYFQGQDRQADDICFVAFSFVNIFWATLFLESWKRRSAELAYKWGTLDKEDELLVEPRPLYTGTLCKSPITSRLEPYYPGWRRHMFRYFVSLPLMAVSLAVVVGTMFGIFELQEFVNAQIAAGQLPKFAKFAPKVLLAVSVGVLDDIYKKLALWLNDQENYRVEETHENHLIIKLVLFQFVNSFISLFYIAFWLRDTARLKETLAALLITRQVIGNIKEAIIPYVLGKFKLYRASKQVGKAKKADGHSHDEKLGDVSHSGSTMSQAESEAAMKQYEDTFEDYLEMFIQFGYVILFSSAFPLAALCAFLNNVIEIRSDAFKLCMTLQRPFGQSVRDIGTWQDALEVMGVVGVMVNCALIGLSDEFHRLVPGLSTVQTILLIVVMEHVLLCLKFGLAYAIPDIPQWVANEMAKIEFLRREAMKKLEGGDVKPDTERTNFENSETSRLVQSRAIGPRTEYDKSDYYTRTTQSTVLTSRTTTGTRKVFDVTGIVRKK